MLRVIKGQGFLSPINRTLAIIYGKGLSMHGQLLKIWNHLLELKALRRLFPLIIATSSKNNHLFSLF